MKANETFATLVQTTSPQGGIAFLEGHRANTSLTLREHDVPNPLSPITWKGEIYSAIVAARVPGSIPFHGSIPMFIDARKTPLGAVWLDYCSTFDGKHASFVYFDLLQASVRDFHVLWSFFHFWRRNLLSTSGAFRSLSSAFFQVCSYFRIPLFF